MNEIEIVVESKDKSDLDKLADKAKRAGKDIGDGIDKGMKEAESASQRASKKIKDDLQEIEKAGQGVGDGITGGLSEAFGGLGDTVGGSAGDILGSLTEGLSAGKAGMIGAGLAVGAFIMDGISMEVQEDKVGSLIAAQTGAAAGQAEKLGNVAGDVFGNAFGASVEEVGEAMSSIFENKLISTDAPEEAIQRVTEKVLTLTETTGESADQIARAASQMVKTGLARSIAEAMDMIQQAQERGLNAADDLFDTISEYSTNFRTLGLEGQEAFGLISQAVDAGARDTDFAADALKEFSIKAQDMSATTRRGFESIGLDADVMGQRIAKGGDSAKSALRDTLNALNQMPPSVERNSAAVDLFGTKAEDLGESLFAMDLDGAADKFGEFAGSVTEAAQKIAEGQSGIDKFNKFVDNTKSGLGELLDFDIPFVEDTENKINELTLAVERWQKTGDIKWLDELKEKYPELAGQIDQYIAKTEGEVKANQEKNDSTEEVVASLDVLIAKQREAATGIIDLSEAQINSNEALVDANEAMKEFAGKGLNDAKTGFDLATEAGATMQGTLNDVVDTTFDTIEAMRQQGVASEEVRAYLDSQRLAFYNLAVGMGISEEAAKALTDRLFGFPDEVVPVVGIQDHATPVLDYLTNRINNIPSYVRTDYYMYTHYMSNSRSGGKEWGGTGGLAHGGIVGAGSVWGAQSGGQRHSSTVINEAGPEMVELPSGARVATAGATRAMGEAGWFGGGGGGSVVANFVIGGPTDELGRAIVNWLQKYVKNEYGGSVASALGQRGGA